MEQKNRRYQMFLFFFLLLIIMGVSGCQKEKTEDALEEVLLEEEPEESVLSETAEPVFNESESIFVHICGAVNTPGVYELDSTARVYEAVQLAGGLREDAASDTLNQARTLTDGEQIYVPTIEEVENAGTAQNDGTGSWHSEVQAAETGKVNLNTATKEELMSLTGIGEAKAASILAYRETAGGFQNIEELMQVKGIKEGTFEKIKDQITV